MPFLSPPTLTQAEQRALLHATAGHPRDHVVFSIALGTGLRLGEIVGLNVADVFYDDGTPRTRVQLRREIAKGGRARSATDRVGLGSTRGWQHTARPVPFRTQPGRASRRHRGGRYEVRAWPSPGAVPRASQPRTGMPASIEIILPADRIGRNGPARRTVNLSQPGARRGRTKDGPAG